MTPGESYFPIKIGVPVVYLLVADLIFYQQARVFLGLRVLGLPAEF